MPVLKGEITHHAKLPSVLSFPTFIVGRKGRDLLHGEEIWILSPT